MSVAIRQVTIAGRVQGVGYRAWVGHQARTHNLEGWVRNRRDGSVEILASGPDAAVGALIASCREGPPSARVERIDIEESDETPPPGFTQLPTA